LDAEGTRQAEGERKICASAIVNWTNKERERQIAEAVERLSGAFGD